MKRLRIVLPVLAGVIMGLLVAGQLQSAEAQRPPPEECSVTLARKTRQLRAARKELEENRTSLQLLLDLERRRAEELERLLAKEQTRVKLLAEMLERQVGHPIGPGPTAPRPRAQPVTEPSGPR